MRARASVVLALALAVIAVAALTGPPVLRVAQSAGSTSRDGERPARSPLTRRATGSERADGSAPGRLDSRARATAMLVLAAHRAPPPRTVRSAVAVVPDRAALRSAARYLRGRKGVSALAVVDSVGRARGLRPHMPFASASVVKAMLLVGYLRGAGGRDLRADERATLGPMIRASDNDAATRVFRSLGSPGLRRVARAAAMRRFAVGTTWTSATITAADQARMFARLDRVLPSRHREFGRELLSSVVPSQSWGIPAAAGSRWREYFKGGWRPTVRGRLVHQVARLEDGQRTVVIAVLTDGSPSHGYGTRTVRGVAQRLLAEPAAPPPAGP